MLLKDTYQAVADWEHTLARMCLGQSGISSIERPPYLQQTPFENNVGLLKGEQLRNPHSRNYDQEHERAVGLVHMIEYHLEVARLKRYFRLNGMPVWKLNAGSGIVVQVAPFLRAAADATHGSAYVVQDRRRVAFFLLVEDICRSGVQMSHRRHWANLGTRCLRRVYRQKFRADAR